ncbi:MAG: hypothetical protein M1420_00180 [Actinobacteria bacterium]|jgi:hypothetical protein|nr:hypothetical protein [Actinomycetota bacterium]
MIEIDQIVLVATMVLAFLVLVAGIVIIVLLTRLRRALQEMVTRIDSESIPVLRDARILAEQAAGEMERVGDVMEVTEAVSATVDSASRLAYRIFANPFVKTVAYASGFRKAGNRLLSPGEDR